MSVNKLRQLLNLRTVAAFRSLPPLFMAKLSTDRSILELKKRKDAFNDTLPGIVESLIASLQFNNIPTITKWIREVLEFNLTGGKQLRGLSTVTAYELLEKPENITEESLRQSRVMGWCLEMVLAYYLMMDDMMDGSGTRRGAPCWYTLPNVGLGAINDAVLIKACVNRILRLHFGHLPQYLEIADLLNKANFYAFAGQHLDNNMAQREKRNYNLFTIDLYKRIAQDKTSFAFILPVSFGMLLANIIDAETHKKAEKICAKIGNLFQMQDDFLDVFALESVTGKFGTDIREGKCTWLAVTALQHCNDAQRREFVTYYGSSDPAHVQRIKSLYEDLNIPEIYRKEELQRYNEVLTLANNFDDSTRAPQLFTYLLDSIYNRSK